MQLIDNVSCSIALAVKSQWFNGSCFSVAVEEENVSLPPPCGEVPAVPQSDHQVKATSCATSCADRVKSSDETATDSGSSQNDAAKDELQEKFLNFCKREGYNPTLESFTKAISSLKNSKKYGPVSKSTSLTPLCEGVYDTTTSCVRISRPLRNETIGPRRRRRSCERRYIKENARVSASMGQTAAAKAVMFILRDAKQANRVVLPPLENATPAESYTVSRNDLPAANSR